MKYALGLWLLVAGCAAAAIALPWWPAQAAALWVGVSLLLAGAAYAGIGPAVLGKRTNGELPAWSVLANGPFLLFALVSMRFFHRATGRHGWHQVAPGLWLGRRPSGRDRTAYEALEIGAVVDLCAELPRSRVLQGDERYLSLPVLDGEAPSASQLATAVAWIEAQRDAGPVLVHCALGHSRSAAVVAAWRMRHADPGTVDAQEQALRTLRPGVRFTPAQRQRLQWWERGMPAVRSSAPGADAQHS